MLAPSSPRRKRDRAENPGPPAQKSTVDIQHPSNARSLTHLEITIPTNEMSKAIGLLNTLGAISIKSGDEYLAVVCLDDHRLGQKADFRPHLPLVLTW